MITIVTNCILISFKEGCNYKHIIALGLFSNLQIRCFVFMSDSKFSKAIYYLDIRMGLP